VCVLGKKKSSEKSKRQALSSKSNEAIDEANATTSISLFTADGREIRTTVQKIDDVLLREKLRRKRAR
jgi:hypothetical protein